MNGCVRSGNRVRSENPENEITTTVYDANSRAVAGIDPLGNRSTTVYDAAGQAIASINPLGFRTTSLYDEAGQPIAVEDANTNRTTTVYDAIGQPVAEVNALGNRTSTVYDAAGNRTALVDPRGNRYSFTYDAAGRETVQTDPLSRRATSAYDAAGRQNLRIDARGNRTTYTHDAVDRLTGQEYPDASRVTIAYDSVGNRTTMHDPTGRYTTTYDALNRAETVVNPDAKMITYAYDAVGQRNFMLEPDGGRFTYSYDARGQIGHLINPQDQRTTYSYDGAARRTGKNLGNGTRASFTYDGAGQLTKLYNLKSDSSVISSFDYQYDNVGNRTSVEEANGDRVTWTYDDTYQLTAEHRSGINAYARTYTYDPAGNRTLKNVDGARTTHSYDVANQLETAEDAAGTTTYTFDANGNQQLVLDPLGARTSTTWDYENQPTLYELPSGELVTVVYDPERYRLKKQSAEGTTKFIWDEHNCLLETNGADVTRCQYTNEPAVYGNIVSQHREGNTSYLYFDGIHSTRNAAGANEDVTDTWIYDGYGNIVDRTGSTLTLPTYVGELGYYLDIGIGLYWVRLRPLQSTSGRWTSRDPLGYRATITNLFIYALNNPLSNVDPSGLRPYCELDFVARGPFTADTGFVYHYGHLIQHYARSRVFVQTKKVGSSSLLATAWGKSTYYQSGPLDPPDRDVWDTVYAGATSGVACRQVGDRCEVVSLGGDGDETNSSGGGLLLLKYSYSISAAAYVHISTSGRSSATIEAKASAGHGYSMAVTGSRDGISTTLLNSGFKGKKTKWDKATVTCSCFDDGYWPCSPCPTKKRE